MASKDGFNLTITVFSGLAESGLKSATMPKTKLTCLYDGLTLSFVMRFGRGTDDTKAPIRVVFDLDAGNLDALTFHQIIQYRKPTAHVFWHCRNAPRISNYTSSRADQNQPDHKFAEYLLREDVKKLSINVPSIPKFSWEDWRIIVSVHEKCVEHRQATLTIYPSPWDANKNLPPRAEAPSHTVLNAFPDIRTWGTVTYAGLTRELAVTLSNKGEAKLKSCWGIFEKFDGSVFCHIYSPPASKNQPNVMVLTVGERLQLYLRDDGRQQLSDSAKEPQEAVVTDIGRDADFVVRLSKSDWTGLGMVRWTDQDMNLGRFSTIAIKRKENMVSIRRHLAGVVKACTIVQKPRAFPLEPLLLLNQAIPRMNRTPITPACKAELVKMLSILNATQQQAFKLSHDTQGPAIVVQGPPGTGKTYGLAVLALSYSIVRHEKCMICTPSNYGANAITEQIKTVATKRVPWLRRPRIARWLTPTVEHCIMTTGRADGVPESMASVSMASYIRAHAERLAEKYCGGDEWLGLSQRLGSLSRPDFERFKILTAEYERVILDQMDIVVTTCDNSWTLSPEYFRPDILILDECSQAIEAAALLPATQFMERLEQVIFAGDDQQLQPFVLSSPAENEFEGQLRKSWFERARLSGVVPSITLGQQYRMRPEISRLIIKHFYRDKLQDDESTKVDRPTYLNYMRLASNINISGVDWAASEWPLSNILLVDMLEGSRVNSKTDGAGSKFNNGHVAIVRDICLTLLSPETNIYGRQIAVLTPYAAQRVRHMRVLSEAARLNQEMGKVVVSTVDRFQGQEADIVLLDLVVRSNRTSALGFMKDRNRLNVAISRARDVLIVIGDGHKYQRMLSKRKVAKQSRLFLEIMCDVGRNIVMWKGSKSDVAEFEKWDIAEEDDREEESDGSGQGDALKEGSGQGDAPNEGGDEALQEVQYRY